jgi:hypothetical protein
LVVLDRQRAWLSWIGREYSLSAGFNWPTQTSVRLASHPRRGATLEEETTNHRVIRSLADSSQATGDL